MDLCLYRETCIYVKMLTKNEEVMELRESRGIIGRVGVKRVLDKIMYI